MIEAKRQAGIASEIIDKGISRLSVVKYNNRINDAKIEADGLELDIMICLIQQIGHNEVRSQKVEYVIDLNELTHLKDLKSKNYFGRKGRVMAAINKLISTPVHISFKEYEFTTALIQESIYIPETRKAVLRISPKLLPGLSCKREFTQFRLSEFVPLRAYHSKRLYMLLAQYRKTGFLIIKLEKLKQYLNIEGKYKRYSDFKQWVLKPAQKELAKTELFIKNISETRIKRKVDCLRITFNKPEERLSVEQNIDLFQLQTFATLTEMGIRANIVEQAINKLGNEETSAIGRKVEKRVKTGICNDVTAYFIKVCHNEHQLMFVN